jgi:hypothetical protein
MGKKRSGMKKLFISLLVLTALNSSAGAVEAYRKVCETMVTDTRPTKLSTNPPGWGVATYAYTVKVERKKGLNFSSDNMTQYKRCEVWLTPRAIELLKKELTVLQAELDKTLVTSSRPDVITFDMIYKYEQHQNRELRFIADVLRDFLENVTNSTLGQILDLRAIRNS